MFNTSQYNSVQYNSQLEDTPTGEVYDDLIEEDVTLSLVGVDSAYLQLIEALSITQTGISEYSPNVTISEDIRIILEDSGIGAAVLEELMKTNSSISSQIVAAIFENILQDDSLLSVGTFGSLVAEDIRITERMRVIFPVVLSLNITASTSLAELLNKYNTIIDSSYITGVFSSVGQMNAAIAASVVVSAALNLNTFAELLSEDFTLSEELVELYIATEALLDALNVDDQADHSLTLTAITSDELSVTLAQSLNFEYSNTIEDEAVFIISYKIGDTVYRGYSYSPETYSVTEYDNFNFNSSAFFNNKYLFAGENGLYLLGGDMDEDQFITARIKTATMDFETSNLKQMPKVYLGVSNDSSLILSIAVDGKYKAQYQLQLDSNDLSTQMFNIGKGLVGRYWQFTLETKGNTTFDLDEIEFFPIIFGRKR